MKLRPLGDRVLIKRLVEDEMTPGGLYIPPVAQEKLNRGEVVAVGPGKTNEEGTTVPLTVEVGDVVIFGKYGGSEIKIDGDDHLVLREDEIFAVIE